MFRLLVCAMQMIRGCPKTQVWCICRVNGTQRVGLVLREVYDRASYLSSPRDSGVVTFSFPETIVTRYNSAEYWKLIEGLRLEEREFTVPLEETSFEDAYQRIHGRCRVAGVACLA